MFTGARKGKKGIGHSRLMQTVEEGIFIPIFICQTEIALSLACVLPRRLLLLFVSYSTFHILLPKQRYFLNIFFNYLMLFLYQVFCLSLNFTHLLTFLCFASSVHCVKQFHFIQKLQPILLLFFFFPVYKKKERLLKFSQQPNRVQYLQNARVLVNFLFL